MLRWYKLWVVCDDIKMQTCAPLWLHQGLVGQAKDMPHLQEGSSCGCAVQKMLGGQKFGR